jgi:hypothetical protein
MEPTTLFLTALLAIAIGLSLGLLGGGGSILTVPILLYVAGLQAHEAIATSLLVVGATSIAAVIPHAKGKRVRYQTGLLFGAASMIGAYGAGRVAKMIPAAVLLLLFGGMMLVTAVAMMRGRKAPAQSEAKSTEKAQLPFVKIILEGLVVGGFTGLVGAGGGFLVVPALVLLGGLAMPEAVGTSLLVIAMKSLAGFAGYLGSVHINWTLALVVTVAAVGGSFVGARLAGKVRPDLLRKAFAWFVVVMAIFILSQELPKLLGHAYTLRDSWPVVLPLELIPIALAAYSLLREAKKASDGPAHAVVEQPARS